MNFNKPKDPSSVKSKLTERLINPEIKKEEVQQQATQPKVEINNNPPSIETKQEVPQVATESATTTTTTAPPQQTTTTNGAAT